MAQQAVSVLDSLGGEFNGQSERLQVIGEGCAELTGATFAPSPPSPDSDAGPAAPGLLVDKFDPFAAKRGVASAPPADPVAADQAPDHLAGPLPEEVDQGDLSQLSLSDEDDTVYDLSDFEAVVVEEAPEPADEDRIYDLSEFEAEAIEIGN